MNCYDNEDAKWFVKWCFENNVDARIRNAVSRAMVINHLGVSTIIHMDEEDFVGWKGLGAKSRAGLMDIKNKLKMDWMEANA